VPPRSGNNVVTIADPDTGLDRHFREMLDLQFVEVETIGTPRC